MAIVRAGQAGGIQAGVSARQTTIGYTAPAFVGDETTALMRRLALNARNNNPRVRGLHANPPTITATSTLDTTLTRTYRWRDSTKNVLNYYGGRASSLFTNLRQFPVTVVSGGPAMGTWRVEAVVDSVKFQIGIYALSASHKFRVLVDGYYVDMTGLAASATSTLTYMTVDFTSAGGRTPRNIVFEGEGNSAFDGFCVLPTEGVYKPGTQVVVAHCVGDSFVANAGATRSHDGFIRVMGDALGLVDCRPGGVGGTGYLNPGSGQTTFRQRISEITDGTPDVIFIGGGYNDYSYTDAALTAECIAYYSLIRANAATADVPIFVFGSWGGKRGPDATTLANELAIKAAVTAMGDPKIFFIPISTDVNGPWFHGTGTTSATDGTGNTDIYIGSDGTHPNDIGHKFLGLRCADAVMRALGVL